jgi:hypothetical protein
MSGVLPIVCVARHCETARSLSGQHAGLADLQCGERNALPLGLLKGIAFAKVFTCALKRAVRTCELAGFGDPAEIDHDLVQWDYGQYEGLRTHEIHERRPQWHCFATAVLRVKRLIRVDRILGWAWTRRPEDFSRSRRQARAYLDMTTIGLEPAIRLWNDAAQVEDRSALVVGRAGTWKCELEKDGPET